MKEEWHGRHRLQMKKMIGVYRQYNRCTSMDVKHFIEDMNIFHNLTK